MEDEARSAVPAWFADYAVLLAVIVATAIVYAPALSGEFVFDDHVQIVEQEAALRGQGAWGALTSDLWTSLGTGQGAVSGYWRPALVAWWMINYRLFGLHPAGWHAASILLHAAVLIAAYGVMRQLSLARTLSAAALLLFALHPVHVESVAWVSGSSDLLLSLGLLASLWAFLSARGRPWGFRPAIAVAIYVPALLAKETAVIFPAIIFAAAWLSAAGAPDARRRTLTAARAAAPFAAACIVYLLARFLVLGGIGAGANPTVSPLNLVLTAPSMVAFYLRQTFYPVWLGPVYPLRMVSLSNLGLSNFVMPLMAVAAAAAVLWPLARRQPVRQLGLALWLLPLLPALNIRAFPDERVVQDRYLYLPVLGALLVLVPAAAGGIRRVAGRRGARADTACLVAAALLAVPMIVRTRVSIGAWMTDLDLAEAGTSSDPGSAQAHIRHGMELHRAGRAADAVAAFDRAMAANPSCEVALLRCHALLDAGRSQEAEQDLRAIVAAGDCAEEAWERLADCFVRQGRLDQAEATLREARRRHPDFACAFTVNLAIVLRAQRRIEEAIAELESIRGSVDARDAPICRRALYELGVFYEQRGRRNEARQALSEYLAMTAGAADAVTTEARRDARRLLERLQD